MTATVDEFLQLRPEDVPSLEYVRIATPYLALPSLVSGLRVADIGCGPGYGSFLTRLGTPELIVTCDVDGVRLPAERQSGVASSLTDACELALRTDGFDIGLMFEVIEHVDQPGDALRELARILGEDGFALVSTPNRAVRLLRFERPWNDEHLREWTPQVFKTQLRRHFDAVELLGVYGEPPLHRFFLDDWRPSLLRLYRRTVRPVLAKVISEKAVGHLTARARGVARQRPEQPDSVEAPTRDLPVEVVTLDPRTWPFFLAPATESCLSVVAVCGSDALRTADIANSIIELFGKRPPTSAESR